MSIFRTYELNCPACNTPVRFDLVMSVSADRRPDLREAILDGSFQRKVCPACATAFRPEPEFTYIDFARGQYIFVYPVDDVIRIRTGEHGHSALQYPDDIDTRRQPAL